MLAVLDSTDDACWHVGHGDCLTLCRGMRDNSIDALVTDPPGGIAFMGKDWDDPTALGEARWRGHGDPFEDAHAK